ncbi:MAG TPA: hypothetical protein VF105_15805 [Gemmatimonadaceae bacterium]
MKTVKSNFAALLAFAVVGLTACGSDSTGPTDLDSASALRSLALGLQQFGGDGTTATLEVDNSFGGIAQFLDQVTVNIDGAPQSMYALALHESFPPGTCEETIFGNIIPADPNVCTPPQLGLAVMLWQSRSPSQPPERMALLVGDVGTSNFDFNFDSPLLTAVGLYVVGQNELWVSQSGTLTSGVAATSQACDVPLPLYAKSGACHIATFDEQGSIVFELFDENGTSTKTQTLTIPRQTLHGLWMAISEVQPIGLTATRLVPRDLMRRLLSR